MNPAPIRVLIVDDDPLVRSALRLMLSGSDEIALVGEAEDGSQVPSAVRECTPDVVLMDIRMPRVDGLAATELLARLPSPPQIIILTTFDDDDHVLRAVRAGASGFLLKNTRAGDLIRAVQLVADGEAILSPAITRKLMAHVSEPPDASRGRKDRATTLLARLTAREHEVARAVGQGKSNAEIGAELFLGIPTVKTHVSRLMAKLDLTNRVQIAMLMHDADQR